MITILSKNKKIDHDTPENMNFVMLDDMMGMAEYSG